MDYQNAQRYDRGMAWLERRGLERLRARAWQGVAGRVLEIGAGTGANQPYYPDGASITAFDIDGESLRWYRQKFGPERTSLLQNDAERLPFVDGTFDAVVGTLTFCSIPDPVRALGEVRRVLRPGGRLVLLEHVRGQKQPLRLLTDALQPLWFALQGECHLNREPEVYLDRAGFTIDGVSTHAWGLIQLLHATH